MSASICSENLTIQFGGHVAVNKMSCAFYPGQVTAIVGPNGAGKTTYFNLLSGQLRASYGKVFLANKDISRMGPAGRAQLGIGRAFQLTNLFPHLTVQENIRLAVQARSGISYIFWRSASVFKKLEQETEKYLFTTRLNALARAPAATLSHGDQRKLEVALLLAMQPSIYMFDEPTAGMSIDQAPEVLELISAIKQDASSTVLLVEHKMDVVRSLADRILVLHNGELIADGEPEEVMESALVRQVYLGKRRDA